MCLLCRMILVTTPPSPFERGCSCPGPVLGVSGRSGRETVFLPGSGSPADNGNLNVKDVRSTTVSLES